MIEIIIERADKIVEDLKVLTAHQLESNSCYAKFKTLIHLFKYKHILICLVAFSSGLKPACNATVHTPYTHTFSHTHA